MRIRSIKPEFWRSADVSALEWHTRLLFIGLWSYVDDNGVGVDREALIAADLFADDLSRDPRETFARVSEGLSELHSAGLIARYSVDSRDYLAIATWKQHQRIDKPNKPRYPEPTSDYAEPRESVARVSRHLPETPAPGTGEQGNRGTEEQGNREGGKVVREGTTAREKASPPPQIPETWIENPRLARCAAHAGMDDPPPCVGCRDARRAAEEAGHARAREQMARAAAVKAERDACTLCDPAGFILDVDEAIRCTHDPDRNGEAVLAADTARREREAADKRARDAAKAAAAARKEAPRGPF